ncbi:MAG: polysaccharide deacetylase family protein [Akkermansiaceae bacterium]|nr:polysaccharide deacetylase family protein [Akkermansiaceae bacterium]
MTSYYGSVLLAAVGMGIGTLHGAYLIEVDIDGLDDGVVSYSPDFAFGGDTTAAFQSAASSAVGLSGGDSIYGGNGSAFPDTYVFTYAPDGQADNQYLDAGAALGNGNFASGAIGGGPGRYAVYAAWPFTTNVNGGLTNYRIETAGDSSLVSIDQNGSGNAWVKVGEVDYTSGPLTVTQTATSNASVSMRAAGILFELLADGSAGGYSGPPGSFILGAGAAEAFGLAFLRNKAEAQTTHFAVLQSADLVNWSTSDLKLVSITDTGAENELVAFRSMTPMATMSRQFLKVQPVPKMPIGNPPKYVAMTFDDGPHPDRTPRLLDILAARNIRATFFVVGTNAEKYPKILRRMINEGHEIGNHTLSHARLTDLTDDEVIAEIDGCRAAVVAGATLPTATIRPPYGAVDNHLRDLFMSEFGYPTVLWNVDPRDWDTAVSDQQVISTILTESDHGEIVLCHDIHERTIGVMPAVLDGLLAQGFSLVTVTELLALQGN